MKLKLTLLYLISFFSLVFLIHELHDWAHTLFARALCGCWGTRAFDFWTPCPDCSRPLVLAWIAGPVINYIFIWAGWFMMSPQNELDRKALGFSLVFAALPFPRLLGALSGGGDETNSLRMIFRHASGDNHRVISIVSLVIVAALTLPPLLRALLTLPGWMGKILVFPAFLLLPGLVDHWLIGKEMNRLLVKGLLVEEQLPGTSLIVVAWLGFLLLLSAITWKKLPTLFAHEDLSL